MLATKHASCILIVSNYIIYSYTTGLFHKYIQPLWMTLNENPGGRGEFWALSRMDQKLFLKKGKAGIWGKSDCVQG